MCFGKFCNGVFECVIKSIHGYIIKYISREGIKRATECYRKKGFSFRKSRGTNALQHIFQPTVRFFHCSLRYGRIAFWSTVSFFLLYVVSLLTLVHCLQIFSSANKLPLILASSSREY